MASPGRHLHQPVADPPLQPAHRRLDRRRSPHPEGRRALLRAGQGRQGQRLPAGGVEAQDHVREPDAAVSGRAARPRTRDEGRREHHRPRDRHARADRQGPARAAGRVAEERQDGDDAADRARDRGQLSRHRAARAADRRAAGRSDRDAALGPRRSRRVDLRRAGHASRAGRRDGDREGEAPGRDEEGRRDPARLDHAPRPRLQHGDPGVGQGA